MNNKTELAEI